jgi:hypothetical protein
MRIGYGDICARCTACGSVNFQHVAPSQLRCAACGACTLRGELVCQVGDEAVKQARASLGALSRHYAAQRQRLARLRRY